MDKHTYNSLIANSGLHFKVYEKDINPEEPLVLESGKTLKYTFLECIDYLNDCRIRFDLCAPHNGVYSPVNYLKENDLLQLMPNGVVALDQNGIPKAKKDIIPALIENYAAGAPELISINSLTSYRIKKDGDVKSAFELLMGKWLPMPMYELDLSGQSTGYPNGWCRVLFEPIGTRQNNGTQRFRFVWAFDTTLSSGLEDANLRPSFLMGSEESKVYKICNRPDLLFGEFLNIPNEESETPISDYIVSLLGIDLTDMTQEHRYKFIGYYIYLINFLRLSGCAPDITLYNKPEKTQIPVDMSVDIGNSRTCAVLFERGDFTKARMLRLRDMTFPWITYENAFDMRIVFRHADFGGDLTQDKNLFQWPSLVRVGEEAKHLVYHSLEGHGESEKLTNYSSPKRYLWDERAFENKWEFMVVKEDPTNVKVNSQIYIEGFTDHFDYDGTYLEELKEINLMDLGLEDEQCHYSRSSLMTFVMIETLQQALSYINSSKFRDMHGQTDCRRYLRNIIMTCPTAMPLAEQKVLRKAAQNAAHLLRAINPSLPEITITPDPEKLTSAPSEDFERGWLYDEAFASQLVYLYAELSERYNGNIKDFFKIKGHFRKDIEMKGFNGEALTIGTIDIGAGTTDVMITAYAQKGKGRLTPIPLFYDSFYTAGDDILHNVIRDIILEGPENDLDNYGSISNALWLRIKRMTPEELLKIPSIRSTRIYKDLVEDIINSFSEEESIRLRRHLTNELMNHFFAIDSANQSEKDRQNRVDFCTQVSLPISQFFLELVKQKRPAKVYTYGDLFPKEKPAEYLLDHFERHFGFRFEDLSWRYDPEEVGRIIRDTVEPLLKVLSVIMYAHHCDILVLSGRPTNLEPLTELFLKYIPIPPHRLVLLNEYRVGRWFPLSTQEGYFQESQKAVVAVGAEVGYLASTQGFNGLVLDFSMFDKNLKSTACYIGKIDSSTSEIREPYLTPFKTLATIKDISVFPYFIGCKQFDSPKYQGRPLYVIYNKSNSPQLTITLQRSYYEDREKIEVEEVTDRNGDTIPNTDVDLRLQTLGQTSSFWMDNGVFTLKIQGNV